MAKKLRLLLIPIVPAAMLGLYVLSILWRVGWAEQQLFGRNYLIPLTLHPRSYDEPGTPDSFGDSTYRFVQKGKVIHVYKQMTNGFQHVYGSALASLELGEFDADLLFRANEYAEALVEKSAGTRYFYLDTKKDLANNAIGREIGNQARQRSLSGSDAEQFILSQALTSIEQGTVFTHYLDPRVSALPSFDTYGCPLLNQIQNAHRRDTSLALRQNQ
jgi:hypothetical protein